MSGPSGMANADQAIPRDVRPGRGWSPQMLELADHIGAHDTLLICAAYGGQELYIPADPAKCPFVDVIGPAKAAIIADVYHRNVIAVPTARYALAEARRAPVIQAARDRRITVAEAARQLGLRRDYVSRLVNRVDSDLPCPSPRGPATDPRQLDMFGAQE